MPSRGCPRSARRARAAARAGRREPRGWTVAEFVTKHARAEQGRAASVRAQQTRPAPQRGTRRPPSCRTALYCDGPVEQTSYRPFDSQRRRPLPAPAPIASTRRAASARRATAPSTMPRKQVLAGVDEAGVAPLGGDPQRLSLEHDDARVRRDPSTCHAIHIPRAHRRRRRRRRRLDRRPYRRRQDSGASDLAIQCACASCSISEPRTRLAAATACARRRAARTYVDADRGVGTPAHPAEAPRGWPGRRAARAAASSRPRHGDQAPPHSSPASATRDRVRCADRAVSDMRPAGRWRRRPGRRRSAAGPAAGRSAGSTTRSNPCG